MQPTLICYDGSEESTRAIDAAAALFASRPAVVLTIASPLRFAEAMAVTATPASAGVFEDLNSRSALERAEAGADQARRLGLDAEARERAVPTTWEGIVDIADEIDAAVIVVGSRGLRGLREAVGGSVSHSVATHARRPVLIVPPAS